VIFVTQRSVFRLADVKLQPVSPTVTVMAATPTTQTSTLCSHTPTASCGPTSPSGNGAHKDSSKSKNTSMGAEAGGNPDIVSSCTEESINTTLRITPHPPPQKSTIWDWPIDSSASTKPRPKSSPTSTPGPEFTTVPRKIPAERIEKEK
jgi:hypothetical protein